MWTCELPVVGSFGSARLLCVGERFVYFLLRERVGDGDRAIFREHILVVTKSNPPIIIQRVLVCPGDSVLNLVALEDSEEVDDGELVCIFRNGSVSVLKRNHDPLDMFTTYLVRRGDLETGQGEDGGEPEGSWEVAGGGEKEGAGLYPAFVPIVGKSLRADKWEDLQVMIHSRRQFFLNKS